MRLRRNEFCPVHRSLFCCGRETLPNRPKLVRLGVQRIDDPHHPRGFRELRSPAEMRKLLNRKIVQQGGICAIWRRYQEAWRLEQAGRERAWALASARAEGVPIRPVAGAWLVRKV